MSSRQIEVFNTRGSKPGVENWSETALATVVRVGGGGSAQGRKAGGAHAKSDFPERDDQKLDRRTARFRKANRLDLQAGAPPACPLNRWKTQGYANYYDTLHLRFDPDKDEVLT